MSTVSDQNPSTAAEVHDQVELDAHDADEPVDVVPEPEAGPDDLPTTGELDSPADAPVAEAVGAQPDEPSLDDAVAAADAVAEAAADAPAVADTGTVPAAPADGEAAPHETEDDLDDLLGMAGVESPDEPLQEAADDPAVAEAAADAAEDIAEEQPDVAEEQQRARRPRRPTSLAEVRDQRELRRMRGRWYVVHTYAGYEQRVKDNLENRIDTYDAWDRIMEVHIPTEEVTEYKKGKKVVSDKKFLPGYVLVRMDLDDDTWGIVRHTPAVTGFVGANGVKPVPLSLRELANTLKLPKEYVEETEEDAAAVEESAVPEKVQIQIDMEVGDTVRVTTGPFADFTGTIDEINLDQAKLRVLVSVFGRETPIELPFDQVASV
jgi:transcriptional antiterminator NusG